MESPILVAILEQAHWVSYNSRIRPQTNRCFFHCSRHRFETCIIQCLSSGGRSGFSDAMLGLAVDG